MNRSGEGCAKGRIRRIDGWALGWEERAETAEERSTSVICQGHQSNVLVSVAGGRAHDIATENTQSPNSDASHIYRASHHLATLVEIGEK